MSRKTKITSLSTNSFQYDEISEAKTYIPLTLDYPLEIPVMNALLEGSMVLVKSLVPVMPNVAS